MNRREAIAALISLPPSTRVTVATLKPTDVIVVESDQRITQDQAEHIKQIVESVWPGHKAIVLDSTLKIKFASGSSPNGPV
jgi:hypothetical protein